VKAPAVETPHPNTEASGSLQTTLVPHSKSIVVYAAFSVGTRDVNRQELVLRVKRGTADQGVSEQSRRDVRFRKTLAEGPT
jgi:hypothetical protein